MRLLIAAALVTIAISGQAEIKRAANGKPDLSGVYDTATLTPLNRPEAFGEKQFMTTEEADQVLAQIQKRYEVVTARENSSADRGAPKKGGDGNNALGAGGVGGYNSFWIDPGSELQTVDGMYRTSIVYDPPNGQQPALTPESQMRMAQTLASFIHNNDGTASWLAHEGPGPFDGPESLAPSERCLISFASTVPSLPSLYNNYKRIVQTEDYVMILQEMVHDARIIRLNSVHGPEHHKSWLGDSIGYWEGDTLVVHTKNFKAVNGLTGSDEKLQVTERFSLLESGDLNYNFTVDNTTAWAKTWSGEYTWSSNPADKVYEYACHEGNYAMGNVLRGARLLESEWTGEVAGGSE